MTSCCSDLPGMVVMASTYYKQADVTDLGHFALMEGASYAWHMPSQMPLSTNVVVCTVLWKEILLKQMKTHCSLSSKDFACILRQ